MRHYRHPPRRKQKNICKEITAAMIPPSIRKVTIQLNSTRNYHHLFPAPPLLIPTNTSICAVHRLANSSSVNRFADCLARNLTAHGFASDNKQRFNRINRGVNLFDFVHHRFVDV